MRRGKRNHCTWTAASQNLTSRPFLLDLGCAPYVLHGVKYIDLVSLEQRCRALRQVRGPQHSQNLTSRPFFVKMACKQNLDLRCVLISDPSTVGAGAKTRLHTPKAVTYHEQSQIIHHDRSQPWAYRIQHKEIYATLYLQARVNRKYIYNKMATMWRTMAPNIVI